MVTSKLTNLLFILVLKREDVWISFSVIPTRSFHIAGPLMETEIFICDDGTVLFFILCTKTAVLSNLVYINWLFHKTQNVFQNGKTCSCYVLILKDVFADCLSFASKFCVCFPILN